MYPSSPSWNAKCIVFTLALASGYWFLPSRNKWVLLLLLYLPYIAMAWYDQAYDCDRRFGATYLHHFYWMVKPEDYQARWDALSPKSKRAVALVDLGLVVVLVAALPAFLRWRPQ